MIQENFVRQESWNDKTKKAIKYATLAGLDVEHLLFTGRSLKDAVCDAAKMAIDVEEFAKGMGFGERFFLEAIRDCLAYDLSSSWGSATNPLEGTPECLHGLALRFLYLFPRLWKATNKLLSKNQIDTLDLKELLSERRKPRSWAKRAAM